MYDGLGILLFIRGNEIDRPGIIEAQQIFNIVALDSARAAIQ